MDAVTPEQIQNAAKTHRISRYELTPCNTCHRGVRYFFYPHDEFLKNKVYHQAGCDCNWQQSFEITYTHFAAVFNAVSPEERAQNWQAFLASGTAQPTPLNSE